MSYRDCGFHLRGERSPHVDPPTVDCGFVAPPAPPPAPGSKTLLDAPEVNCGFEPYGRSSYAEAAEVDGTFSVDMIEPPKTVAQDAPVAKATAKGKAAKK